MANDLTITFESSSKLCRKWNDVITCEDKAFDAVKETMPSVRASQKAQLAMQMEQLQITK